MLLQGSHPGGRFHCEDGWEDALSHHLWSTDTDAQAHFCVVACVDKGYGSKIPTVV